MKDRDYREIIKWLKIFVIGALALFAVTGGAILTKVITDAFNAKDITNAQVEVFNAQRDNVGKPQTIIQRHEYPK